MNFLERIRQIDILRIAGVRSVLGLDISADKAFCVELGRIGSFLNRYTSGFRCLKSFSVEFPPDSQPAERAAKIREALKLHEVGTRFAAVALRPASVKTMTIENPEGVGDLHSWVHENTDRLMKLPVDPGKIAFSLELSGTGGSKKVRIRFVRTEELSRLKQTVAECGLVTQCVGAGVLDIVNLVLDTARDGDRIVFSEGAMATVLQFEEGRVSERIVPTSAVGEVALPTARESSGKLWLAGDVETPEWAAHARLLRFFDLQPMFSLAAGLAVRAWLPDIGETDFRNASEKDHATASVLRRACTRAVTVCGFLLLFLLGLEYAASAYVQGESERIDEELNASGRTHATIRRLELEISDLKGGLDGSAPEAERTHAARLLHEIGAAAPNRVLAHRLTLEEGQSRSFTLYGRARSAEDITALLKSLQSVCDEVRLVRTGSDSRNTQSFLSRRAGREDLQFEVTGKPR